MQMVIYVPITNRISCNFDRNILKRVINIIYIILTVFYHYILPMPCMLTKIVYSKKLNETDLNKTQTGMVIIHGKEWIVNPSFIKLIFLNKV
jgi:hypothetical protein